MAQAQRAGHMDVSNTVDVSDPVAVAGEVRRILENRYEGFDYSPIDQLARDFSRLYRGSFPGFRACDIKYHDIQHVLDVTLAMARLLDGHDGRHDRTEHLGNPDRTRRSREESRSRFPRGVRQPGRDRLREYPEGVE